MPSPTPDLVKKFHATYIRETGLPISLGFDRQRWWHELLRREFGFPAAPLTLDDLVMVIRYLRRGIERGERNPGCLRFRNLIEQPDYFEEELMLARKSVNARQRPPMTPRPVAVETGEGIVRRLVDGREEAAPRLAGEEGRKVLRELTRKIKGREHIE